MKNIFTRSLETTVTKVSIILFILAGAVMGYILNKNICYAGDPGAYVETLNNALELQHIFMFLGLEGVLLMLVVASNSTGMIATELHEGTFKLLAAKPNSRSQILFGKMAGVFVGSVLLLGLGLTAYYSSIIALGCIDGVLLKDLIRYLPAYFVYGLIIIVVIEALGTLLSCLFRKKIGALLIMIAFIIVTFGFFTIMRFILAFMSKGTSSAIALVDFNYHFALIFKMCVESVDKISGSQIIGVLTNLFGSVVLDPDVARQEWGMTMYVENTMFSSYAVLAAYLAASLMAYVGSFVIIRKKDI